MSENNLPIKLVIPQNSDFIHNTGRGSVKFFGAVTPQLTEEITNKFNNLLSFYADVFEENSSIPAVGKITVKSEAIAKSHKPVALCQKCPIIGSEDLDEIYIRIDKQSIQETINLINNPPSERFRANMTAVLDIQPIEPGQKILPELETIAEDNITAKKKAIKLKVFDFGNDFDNEQIWAYVRQKLNHFKLGNFEEITYGDKLKFFKVEVNSYRDIIDLASINGVKTLSFFQEYSVPTDYFSNTITREFLNTNFRDSNLQIGIIDGGISDSNPYLKQYVVAREEYVPRDYQNHDHATFIASTIQYGNALNNIPSSTAYRFKFVDIVAIPNSVPEVGLTDTISEDDLMVIIQDVMEKYSKTTRIWNMSLGIVNNRCVGDMTDLGIFLDYIQDKYHVQIFVSSGNITNHPFRCWPPQDVIGERDRIISPAESVRAITVGSVALSESNDSMVKRNEPSPFSCRGPGANYIVKPDIVDYGGNISKLYDKKGLGILGLNTSGAIVEGIGTSYSTPRSLQKFASIYEEMIDPDLLLTKAMLIHSARMNSRALIDDNPDYIKYYGFGLPSSDTTSILQCSEDRVTIIFKQKISQGTHLEMSNFPYPDSLIQNNKYFGEICMTLVYLPPLDPNYGREYCRTNIDASFGTYTSSDGRVLYSSKVPLETEWDQKFESERVQHGFKWSPIKSYYRNLTRGINIADGWKLRIDLTPRFGISEHTQEFVLILTIIDPNGHDIYSEVTNGLRERGYITQNIETKYQIRQRQ